MHSYTGFDTTGYSLGPGQRQARRVSLAVPLVPKFTSMELSTALLAHKSAPESKFPLLLSLAVLHVLMATST